MLKKINILFSPSKENRIKDTNVTSMATVNTYIRQIDVLNHIDVAIQSENDIVSHQRI